MKRSLIYIMIFITGLVLLTCKADLNNPNAISNDANAFLQKLVVSQGVLNPVFDRYTSEYTVSLDDAVSSITVTPTAERIYATINVNETAVESGAESDDIELSSDARTVTITVISPNQKNTKTYTISFLSNNADLSGLNTSSGTLNPAFDPDTTSYFIGFANNVTSLTLSPAVDNDSASYIVSPSSTVNLNAGPNDISVLVTAEDGETIKTYTIEAYRAIGIPKTGQTTSYDTGDADDGYLKKGVAWPSPRFTDNSDGTITDNLTGLMWLKDANCISTNDATYDFDNDGTAGDGMVTWQHALDFVTGMNAGTYQNGGFTDWRLPNVNELESLIDAGMATPSLPAGHPFDNVQSVINKIYWSSTSSAYDTTQAFVIDMDGNRAAYLKTQLNFVWPVRSGGGGTVNLPPTGQTSCWNTNGNPRSCTGTGEDGESQTGIKLPGVRLTNNGDGTVTDNLTGLMWAANANIQSGPSQWQAALTYVTGINGGAGTYGYTDWRLPNKNELESLLDLGESPALPAGHPFSNVQLWYWASTTYACCTTGAGALEANHGTVSNYNGKTNTFWVWPVRGGQ